MQSNMHCRAQVSARTALCLHIARMNDEMAHYWAAISWALCHMMTVRNLVDCVQRRMEDPQHPMRILDNIMEDLWHATIPVTQTLLQALVEYPQLSENIVVNLLLDIVSMHITDAFKIYSEDPFAEHSTTWRFILRHMAVQHQIRTGMRPSRIVKWSTGWITMDFATDAHAHWVETNEMHIDFQWNNDL